MSANGGRWVRFVLSLALAGCLVVPAICPAHAQTSDIIVVIDEVDTSAFPTITVRASVRTRNGVPIQDLGAEHFEIIEDGAAVHRPESVNVESNDRAQVSLAIVIDTYRTLQGAPIEAAQQATNDLLEELLNEPNDPDRAAFVAVHRGVSTDPRSLDPDYEVGFTNDRNLLLNVINFLHERIETSGAGTPLYDAVVKAVRMTAATEPVGHRAVIVMTDGEDRDSISTDSDTIQTALNERTPVFTIGLSNRRLNEQYLRRLADQTGGTYQAAQTPDDFSPLFSNVLTMLRTQYVLTYRSGLPSDGQPHSILLHVRTPTQLEAFQEQRIETPGGGVPEGGEGEPTAEPGAPSEVTPTVAPPTPAPTPQADILTTVRDFVRDNLVLTIVGIAGIGLVFLILVVLIIVLVRRRRQVAGGAAPELELPPIPESPGYEPSGVTGPAGGPAPAEGEWAGPTRRGGATGPAAGEPAFSTPTVAAAGGAPPLGTRPSAPPSVPPVVPPPFAAPPPTPPAVPAAAPAGRTQILDRTPKMASVGLLIDRVQPERRFDIAKRAITIGRAPSCDIVIDHPTVSRQHASIKFEGEQFRLYDLGSSNGTFLGDQRVREPVALEDGAAVRFGGVEFVFKVVSLNA
jgi:uncharacterized protein YegL/Na+-transporting methylmalonyl-CoA/oxaloacetate decarboxylase gamma subunit